MPKTMGEKQNIATQVEHDIHAWLSNSSVVATQSVFQI
jgi:hypothetical protein